MRLGVLDRVLGTDTPSSRQGRRAVFVLVLLSWVCAAGAADLGYFGQGAELESIASCPRGIQIEFTFASQTIDAVSVYVVDELGSEGMWAMIFDESYAFVGSSAATFVGGETLHWVELPITGAPEVLAGFYYVFVFADAGSGDAWLAGDTFGTPVDGYPFVATGCPFGGGDISTEGVTMVDYVPSLWVTVTEVVDPPPGGGGGDPMQLYPLLFTGFMFIGFISGALLGWSMG